MLLFLMVLTAIGCSQAGSLQQGSDDTTDGELSPQDVGNEAVGDVVEPDQASEDLSSDLDVTPQDTDEEAIEDDIHGDADAAEDLLEPSLASPIWGLVSSGGTAVSDAFLLRWRLWEQLSPVRAASTNYNFFGGIVQLP
jgi:hypothetical protein